MVPICVINYNGFIDTIELVRSLEKSEEDEIDCIIVENARKRHKT